MKKNEFQCAKCGEIFKNGWTDEEAQNEAKEIFGKYPKDWACESAVVCDDCFNNQYPKDNPDQVDLARIFI